MICDFDDEGLVAMWGSGLERGRFFAVTGLSGLISPSLFGFADTGVVLVLRLSLLLARASILSMTAAKRLSRIAGTTRVASLVLLSSDSFVGDSRISLVVGGSGDA